MSTTRTRVRQSFLATYDSCPLSALLGESDGAQTHALSRGTIFHLFAEAYLRECVDDAKQLLEPDRARELMETAIIGSGLPVSLVETDVLFALAWKFATEQIIDVDAIVDLEEPYELDIDGHLITGRLDVVEIRDGHATVKDHKTAWAIDDQADTDGTFQGRVYARMVFERWPQVHTVTVVLSYVRWGAERSVHFTRKDIPAMDRLLSVLVRRVARSRETGEWAASPGSWCTRCASPESCPLPASQRDAGSITNAQDAAAVAEALVPLEEIVKREKKALRAYVSENGPITVGDREWSLARNSDSWTVIDRDELWEAMAAHGVTPIDRYFQRRQGATVFGYRKGES